MRLKKKSPLIITLILLILSLSTITCPVTAPEGCAVASTGSSNAVNPLPVVGTLDSLKKLLQTAENNYKYRMGGTVMFESKSRQNLQTDAAGAGAAAPPSPSASPQYSSTNIQVAGVDEADLVKNDGTYIYQVSNQRIIITQAYPATEMRVVNTVQFEDQNFYPAELYLDSTHLVVIGSRYANRWEPQDKSSQSIACPPYRSLNTTVAKIYTIKNKNDIKMLREVEIEGSYVSSRKIGASLYLVANRYIDYYCLENGTETTPRYRDSAQAGSFRSIDYAAIRYFPGDITPNYLTIAGIKLDNTSTPADVQTYLGSGEHIYASAQNLYVAVTKSQYRQSPAAEGNIQPYLPPTLTTQIYRFGLDNGNIKYNGKGEVPGTILNQYSLDEHKGYLRAATTSGEMWRSDEQTSQNNLYLLDGSMNIAGRLEGLAPGEKIYSTRFMGDRAYLVTFRNVDPLFVIDLKDPASPKVIGKLKIPGYSNYLHPYDETHIIGFGKDTVEMKDWDGSSQAFYMGMKIAIFDVTDVNNPVELSKAVIGDRGTDSELLSNPRALLFAPNHNLLAFPVTVMKINNKNTAGSQVPQFGSFAFQGAYIYNVDLSQGLTFKGAITHLDADDYARAGDYWYSSDKNISRIIYINDTLYTVSNAKIKANRLSDLTELKVLSLK
ncbi:MAG: beta-propeller domain-containing protein [Syntrophomonadaceae bacterium]|jgi:inhibitor of cysteine peptidase